MGGGMEHQISPSCEPARAAGPAEPSALLRLLSQGPPASSAGPRRCLALIADAGRVQRLPPCFALLGGAWAAAARAGRPLF